MCPSYRTHVKGSQSPSLLYQDFPFSIQSGSMDLDPYSSTKSGNYQGQDSKA